MAALLHPTNQDNAAAGLHSEQSKRSATDPHEISMDGPLLSLTDDFFYIKGTPASIHSLHVLFCSQLKYKRSRRKQNA
jgi:hypothetical protein